MSSALHRAYIAYINAESIDMPNDALESALTCPAAAVLDDEAAAIVCELLVVGAVVAAFTCTEAELDAVMGT